jgi:PilZ domain
VQNLASEQRRWQRVRLAFPMFVNGTNERQEGVVELAAVLNISSGGALLTTRQRLSPFSKIVLQAPRLAHPDSPVFNSSVSVIEGRVLRVQPSFGCYLNAIEFFLPLPE